VHVRHADAELHEPARAGTPEATDDLVEASGDARGQVRIGRGRCIARMDSSHDVNNLSAGNDFVNRDYC
jgi:hypothetical protein